MARIKGVNRTVEVNALKEGTVEVVIRVGKTLVCPIVLTTEGATDLMAALDEAIDEAGEE